MLFRSVSTAEPDPVAAKKELEGPDAGRATDLSLQMEMWRQGGDAPSSKVLLEALENRSEFERGGLVVIINALADLGVKQSAGTLINLMGETSDGNLLSVLCKALAELGVEQAAPNLIRLLVDARPGVRRAAARALGRLRVPVALAELERLASEDEQESVKLAARAASLLVKARRQT